MRKKIYSIKLAAFILMLSLQFAKAQNNGSYNVKQYGAIGDGKNLDSKAINKAIDAAANAGGGTVFIPAGNYLSGSIRLKSNVSLYIDQGATIIAAPVTEANDYDDEENTINTIYQDSGHSHFHNSLIWGENLHDVSILGQGTIWGKDLYHDYVKSKQSANKAIALYKCRNVNISDITIAHGGWFGILATGVDNLTINNIKEDTNRDGMDIDCCRNVHVSNCSVNSPNDDGICLKSTFALGFARATENVTITNCIVSGFNEGSFLDGTYQRNPDPNFEPTGRIKLGTESNGGFKNITISNCTFNYCRGLALETVDGGLLEDVTITNITMRDIANAPIFLRLASRMRGPDTAKIGELRRVIISNIVAYNVRHTILISGIKDHNIKDIEIKNAKFYFKGNGTAEQAKREVPELEKGYPEPGSFGILPAYGIYARHVDGLKLEDIELHVINNDARPAISFDDVNSAGLLFVKAPNSTGASPIVQTNSSGITLFQSLNLPDGKLNP
ncbi:Polygalacturonase [Mucilaginibacter mallensis]|uniref:Polygalacturonase n=1 Tax=Mucilaginibacter mallensis TaxID=652787 RepID=A0A1H1QJA6_MUCMA|nr:glycoside hydrolase family 28 protein [Mucilaginibacter mallensis]SDS23558.1 Polygalacturonase [Mucilaginibacter mallensis]